MSEMSDIDSIFWGTNIAYPIEIKEKTSATDRRMGDWFGLDVGPFVKLAFYTSLDKAMASLFIVHEIDDTTTRNSVAWHAITFDQLAKVASWTQQGGGTSMGGGQSAVVRIPKSAFSKLDASFLAAL